MLSHDGQIKIKSSASKTASQLIQLRVIVLCKNLFGKKGDRKKRLLTKLKKIINGASITKIKFVVIPLVDNGKIRNEKQKNTYQ